MKKETQSISMIQSSKKRRRRYDKKRIAHCEQCDESNNHDQSFELTSFKSFQVNYSQQ
jgi:hypothetical protein